MQVISLLRADSTQTDLCLVRFLSLLSVRLCVHTHTMLFRSVGPASRGLSLLRSSLCASSSSSSSSSSSASNSLLLLSSSSALNMGPSHVRFKTVKAGGSTKNNRDSAGRRLGMKRNQDQFVRVGTIIMRQRGTKWHAGKGTFIGKDHTIHADVDGIVTFTRSKLEGFRRKKWRRYANVVPYTVREGAQGNEIKDPTDGRAALQTWMEEQEDLYKFKQKRNQMRADRRKSVENWTSYYAFLDEFKHRIKNEHNKKHGQPLIPVEKMKKSRQPPAPDHLHRDYDTVFI